MMRPIARWHGGKWRLAPWIISHFPPHRVYVEPYCGAASVLLRKSRSQTEVLNDAFNRIVNCFRVVREHPYELAEFLRLTPYSEVEYERSREISPDPIEDARRLLVLGHQSRASSGVCTNGHNSGWRRGIRATGKNSAVEWASLWRLVELWADRLRDVYLECDEATNVIQRWDTPETLHYVDPPYLQSTRRESSRHTAYGDHEMSEDDHIGLLETLKMCRGMVVLSGYPSKLYDIELSDWERIEREVCADMGMKRTECIWLNPKAAASGSLFEKQEAV